MKELTDKQTKFLELIFLPEYLGKEHQAMLDAGYSENTSLAHVYEGLRKEIIDKADSILVRKVFKSLGAIDSVLDDAAQKGAKTKLEAAAMVLDRIGLSKKDRLELEVKDTNGIFLLPKKEPE